ncbi:unnamed protein product [marine sediment metagenome]|uniref:Uncharacterized protein n=1 Tax=marine sediment metagenome TaxID=412755 RepID=X1VDD1_9ZZZZ
MIKIGMYLPVYGGWLPIPESGRAQGDQTYFIGEEEEKPPTYSYVK